MLPKGPKNLFNKKIKRYCNSMNSKGTSVVYISIAVVEKILISCKNKKNETVCVTLYTLWRHLWSVTVHTHTQENVIYLLLTVDNARKHSLLQQTWSTKVLFVIQLFYFAGAKRYLWMSVCNDICYLYIYCHFHLWCTSN